MNLELGTLTPLNLELGTLNLLVSIIPIILYLIVLHAMDGFELARWRMLAGMLLWGLLSMLLMLGIVHGYRILSGGEPWSSPWISPLVEELLKSAPLLLLIIRRRVVFYAEAQIYGQMIGGGFALGENIYYASILPDMTVTTALVRGLDTSLMHMGCTALLASLTLFPLLYTCDHRLKFWHKMAVCCIPVPSVLIHSLHNQNFVSPFIQLIVIVAGFFLLFMIVEHINERLIIKWMDVSITEDVKLLQSLKNGTLIGTRAGRYLIEIRNRFEPLVFFDMCVYVSLYLELLINAKSQMMLREAGLDTPLDEESQGLIRSKKQELNTLSSRLPSSSHRLLRPLIHANSQNRWAINHL